MPTMAIAAQLFRLHGYPLQTLKPILFVDLTRAWDIHRVVLYPAVGEEQLFPLDFDLQVSQDGQEWVTVQSFSDVSGIDTEGFSIEVNCSAAWVRLLVHRMAADAVDFRWALGEIEVLASVSRLDNMVLKQDDMWLYTDSTASLAVNYWRVDGTKGEHELSYFTDDPTVATVNTEGRITPTGYGDTTLYVYDGENLSSCHVRVLDDSQTEFHISTYYLPARIYPDVMTVCLDYLKEAGITFFEATGATDVVGNVICDYTMYLCAKRDIWYMVCDPVNRGALIKLDDEEIIELVQKYENRAGFGGIYLADEPGGESNSYAHIVHIINQYNPHITAYVNLFPPLDDIASWDEYVSDYCAVAGTLGHWNYLSYDHYGYKVYEDFNWDVFDSINRIRRYGLQYNVSTAYYLQCMEITDVYRISSDEELLFNASMGLAYGMKNFQWFVSVTPFNSSEPFVTGLIGLDFTPSVMYEGVKAANAKIAEWGRVLGKSDAIEVYHTDSVVGNEIVPEDFLLKQTTENEAIYTLYRSNEDGQQYVVVVNRDWGKDKDKEFTFAVPAELTSLDLYENGDWTALNLQDGSFTLFIEAGDSAILRLPEGYDARRPSGEPSENLALGCGVYVSSSQYDFRTAIERGAWHLTDGNIASGGWSAGRSDSAPMLTVDLGEVQQVSSVRLYEYVTREELMPESVTIEASEDGVTWMQVFAEKALTATDGCIECGFDTVNARFLRLTTETPQCSIGEIEVY